MRRYPRSALRAVGGCVLAGGRLARPSGWDWLGGAAIAAVLALLVIVAHLRRRPGTPD